MVFCSKKQKKLELNVALKNFYRIFLVFAKSQAKMREKIIKFCNFFPLPSFSTPTSNHFWNLHKISENLIYNIPMLTKSQHRLNLSLLLTVLKNCFGMIMPLSEGFSQVWIQNRIKKPLFQAESTFYRTWNS